MLSPASILDFSDLPIGIFTGGMAYGNKNKGLTIMRGRSKTLLLADHVVDFQVLISTPPGAGKHRHRVLVVLSNIGVGP